MSRWLLLAVFAVSVAIGSWCVLTTSSGEGSARQESPAFALNWSVPEADLRDFSEDVRAGNIDQCLRRIAGFTFRPAVSGSASTSTPPSPRPSCAHNVH